MCQECTVHVVLTAVRMCVCVCVCTGAASSVWTNAFGLLPWACRYDGSMLCCRCVDARRFIASTCTDTRSVFTWCVPQSMALIGLQRFYLSHLGCHVAHHFIIARNTPTHTALHLLHRIISNTGPSVPGKPFGPTAPVRLSFPCIP